MSWWDDVTGAIGGVVDWFGSNKTAGNILSTVVTGYALNKVQDSIASDAKKNTTTTTRAQMDYGIQINLPPNQDNKIPVVYGTAVVAGVITDAVMSADRKTMTYVLTICEKTTTGTITFDEIYLGKSKVAFQSDGITAASLTDDNGNVDTNINGLVKIRCYNDGSTSSTSPTGYSASMSYAFDHVPNWDNTYTMNDYVFAVVEVTYSREKGFTGVPSLTFKIKNSLTQPGDVLYDFMTNTRYGAGINPASISY
jgi:hypothetical protein